MKNKPYQVSDCGKYWDYNFSIDRKTYEVSVDKKTGEMFFNLDEDQRISICLCCGDDLSNTEITNGEDTCFPCQKGNKECCSGGNL